MKGGLGIENKLIQGLNYNMQLKRITVDTKDVQTLTGRSYWYALKVMNEIRKRSGKEKHQLVSVFELCNYLSLPVEETISQLGLGK